MQENRAPYTMNRANIPSNTVPMNNGVPLQIT